MNFTGRLMDVFDCFKERFARFLDVFELKKIFAKGNKMPDPCCERTFSDVT